MTKIFCTAKSCQFHAPEYECTLNEIQVDTSDKGPSDDTDCKSFEPKERTK